MSGQRSMVSGLSASVLAMLLVASCSARDSEPADPTEVTSTQSQSVELLTGSDCPHFDCQGALDPGRYRAEYFDPTIEFEIRSPGWTWAYSGNFAMIADESHQELYASDGIYLLRDPAIASQDCGDEKATESVEPGVGASVRELVRWLEGSPSLDVSEPVPVTVGGLNGMRLDLRLDPGWKQTCFYSDPMPTAPLIINKADVGGYNWAMLPGMSLRWYVLDSGDGVMVIDIEDGPGGASHDDLFRSGGQIVGSFRFS
ncbi:MAG: hypothetical protein K0R20_2401 [Actinomycetia bacterium]|nr:hypothetical protein [Actinomycetes bacterium]